MKKIVDGAMSQAYKISAAYMPQATQQPMQSSVADELTKLSSLKEQGTLTQAEFDAEKSKLLNR